MQIFNSKFVKIAATLVAVFAVVAVMAPSGANANVVSCTFTRSLTTGVTGADVLCLQQYLNGAGFTVATSGAGSPGNETSYFGSRTRAAVSTWQAANGVSPTAGYFGPISRTKYSALLAGGTVSTGLPVGCTSTAGFSPITGVSCATGVSTGLPVGCTSTAGFSPITGVSCATGVSTIPATGGDLTVTAGAQPVNSLAPQSAARVPFTTFTLTAGASDVTVTGVTIQRTGLASDSVFSGIVLLDQSGLQIGNAKTLNSNHITTVGETVTIPAGQSRTYTVAGNMVADNSTRAGQVVSLTVTGIQTTATVSGTLPITGASQTINASLTLGAATLLVSAFDPNAATTKNVGDVDVKFSGVRVTAGSAEAVRLRSVRFNQSGSAGATDMANVRVIVDGTSYPATVSSDGKYYTAVFGTGIVLDKGLSKEVYIMGDLIGSASANRTAEFDIYKNTDLYLTGETYGYGIVATSGGNCNATASTATTASEFINSSTSCASSGSIGSPFYSASVITINAGSATTITKANEVPAANIAVNIPNVILGGFSTDIKGEPISVQSMIFTVSSTSATAGGPLTSVAIYDSNGAVVAGPIDEAAVANAGNGLTFTDTVTFPVGRRIYTIKGKLASNTTNGATIVLGATPSSGWTNVTGQITGNSISLSSNGVFAMNTMTVRAASLAVTVSTDPVAQNVVAGAQNFTFGNIQLDASQSAEDIRVNNLLVSLTYSSTTAAGDRISSCVVYDGATALTTGSNVYNPSNATTTAPTTRTFTFDNGLTVLKGTVKTLGIKCNVSSSAEAGGRYAFGVLTGTGATGVGSISATGLQSSGTVTPTGPTNAGQNMTVTTTGSLVASTDPSTPGYTIASAGSTGVTMGVFKLRASNEDINVFRIGLHLTNTASSTAADVGNVYLYAGSTLLGTATFTGGNVDATSTLSTVLNVPRDTETRVTVKADLPNIGISYPAVDGHIVAIDIDVAGAAGNNNTSGTGVQSGATVDPTGSTAVAGIRLFKSYPVFAIDTLPAGGVADGRLMRFKVTANAKGDIGIGKFSATLATTSASSAAGMITNANIFGFTDSAYSQPISGINTGGQFLTTSLCASGCTSNSPTLLFYSQTTAGASTTVQVPAGETRYFEVRATVAGNGTSYSVTTSLLGDTAYPSLASTFTTSSFTETASTTDAAGGGGAGNAGARFMWATNATTTTGFTGNNWTNGFGLQGLPSSGIITTRTN